MPRQNARADLIEFRGRNSWPNRGGRFVQRFANDFSDRAQQL
jgi:hypothetical protein